MAGFFNSWSIQRRTRVVGQIYLFHVDDTIEIIRVGTSEMGTIKVTGTGVLGAAEATGTLHIPNLGNVAVGQITGPQPSGGGTALYLLEVTHHAAASEVTPAKIVFSIVKQPSADSEQSAGEYEGDEQQ